MKRSMNEIKCPNCGEVTVNESQYAELLSPAEFDKDARSDEAGTGLAEQKAMNEQQSD